MIGLGSDKSLWVCVGISIYGSRWVLASLAVLGRLHWVDKEKLTNFILACQVNNVQNGPSVCSLIHIQNRTQKLVVLLIDLVIFQIPSTLFLVWQDLVCWETRG